MKKINNEFYNSLGSLWVSGEDHPAALLRAENKLRIPWIADEIGKRFDSSVSVLDIGCGAGLLSNALAALGHKVFGIDISENSLHVAKLHDKTQSVEYRVADAYRLPFADNSFEVVCAMDLLEHIEDPKTCISEAARVLKPEGIFFFHTFNRNPLSYLVIIKGVEWCVRNAPQNMHVYPLFIKPSELSAYCNEFGLSIQTIEGVRPHFFSLPFLRMLVTRKVSEDFAFKFTKSLLTGYCGFARKGS